MLLRIPRSLALLATLLCVSALNAQEFNLTYYAQSYLQSLEGETADTLYALDDEERFDWHFVPRARPGLAMRHMSELQYTMVHALVWFSLSQRGYAKSMDVLEAEVFTDIIMNRHHEGLYFSTFFGEPSLDEIWGWRFEGHHLSLNFLVEDGEVVRSTPAFWGSNPGSVTFGEEVGRRFLYAEEELGFKLINSLPEDLQAQAIIADQAPRDIVSGTDRVADVPERRGVSYAEMPEDSRWIADQLLEVYLGSFKEPIAKDMRDRIKAAGYDTLKFAWAGALGPGIGHYYRIHGPTVLIEFDNVQNDANHIHSVVRDLEKDFGDDLLRLHYDTASAHHGHDH